MSEDQKTLWVGNLHAKVTDELIYELFLQTGPIDRVIFPSEGDGDNKKNKGHAYVVFKHPESVQFASQVLEGTTLFNNPLELKARSLPITYRSSSYGPPSNSNTFNKSRFDNSSLRGGFSRSSTWHGREDFVPRGRGGGSYRNRMGGGGSGGGGSNYNQNSNSSYNVSYNNYNNQMNSAGSYWANSQQGNSDSNSSSYTSTNLEEKRQRLLQQQNLTLQNQNQQQQQQQQQQQGMMTMVPQMYSTQQQSQPQQQQQNWANNSYTTNNDGYSMGTTNAWNMQAASDGSTQQAYSDQYGTGTWYQPLS